MLLESGTKMQLMVLLVIFQKENKYKMLCYKFYGVSLCLTKQQQQKSVNEKEGDNKLH